MAAGPVGEATKQVERLFTAGGVAGLSEQQLLDRFVARRDEAAFEALVARHGPMVLGICRRWLHDPNDVDDAFQATFLVLVRKAGSLRRRELLANWLYGVASRVALRARAISARDAARKANGADTLPAAEAPAIEAELHQWLHQEIGRLPEKYRAPVVLCYLEGLTHDEAAERLGWPVGSVKGRLARARDLLRSRLTRRGITSAGAGALIAKLPAEVLGALPAPLVDSTVRGLVAPVTRPFAGPVLTLAEGVIHAMLITKLKLVGLALVMAAGFVGAGAAVRAYEGPERSVASAPAESKVEQKSVARDVAKTGVRKPHSTPDPFDTPEMVGPNVAKAETPKGHSGQGPGAGDAKAEGTTQAERAAFETLLKTNEPRTVDQTVILYKWSRRILETHLNSMEDPAARLSTLRAHLERMQALVKQVESRTSPDVVAVARAYALDAWTQLAAAGETAPAGGTRTAPGVGPPDGGFGMIAGGGGGFLNEMSEEGVIRAEISSLAARVQHRDPANKAVLDRLDKRVSMNFANETPLEDVLKYIKVADDDNTERPPIPIYVDPQGLQEIEVSLSQPIVMDLDGIPLKVTLRLALRQLGLAYCVKDGILMISTPEIIRDELMEAERMLAHPEQR